jgi:hypothetical protein
MAELKTGSTVNGSTILTDSAPKFIEVQETVVAVPSLDLDLENGTVFTKTITGNSTFTFSNPAASGTASSFTFILNSGSNTVTWPGSVDWAAATAPDLTGVNILGFTTTDGGTTWYGVVGALGAS